MKYKSYLMIIPVLFYMLLFPLDAFQASCRGLNLWFETVLPSLLPFIILSNILISMDVISLLSGRISHLWKILFGTSSYGAYVFFLGLMCGYPMGAKLCADLWKSGKLSEDEANYLLTFTNNASPVFISSFLVLNIWKNQNFMFPAFAILYGANILCMTIFRIRNFLFKNKKTITACETVFHKKEVSLSESIGKLIDTSIMNGFEVITRLGGYIILFSLIASMTEKIFASYTVLLPAIAGIMELTTGVHTIATSVWNIKTQYAAIFFCTAFGGISTLAQTRSVLQGTPLSFRTYCTAKILNGIFAYTLFLLYFHCHT